MAAVLLGQLFAYPIHPERWARPKGDRGYRVTNGFDGPDYLNGGKHRATDVGNYRTGDPVLMPVDGMARGLRHTDGALGIEVILGGMVTLELWHLSLVRLPFTWSDVPAGVVIGATGNSGANLPDGSPMPQHTHIALKRDGMPFDVEPHLPMPERAARPIILDGEADDVKIPGRFLRHVQNRRAVLTTDSHFREGVEAGADASLGVLKAGTLLFPIYVTVGRAVGTAPDAAEWHGALAYVNGAYHLGHVHSSVLPRTEDGQAVRLDPIEAVDCSRQDNALAAIATAADGAAQAIAVIQRSAKP